MQEKWTVLWIERERENEEKGKTESCHKDEKSLDDGNDRGGNPL